MVELPVVTKERSELVWVSGPDAVGFLDGLLSQSIAGMPVGGTARSLLLAPNGKLRAMLFVLRGEDRVGLVCDVGRGDVVARDLGRFKIRVDVKIERATETVWEVWGATAGAAPPLGTWAVDAGSLRFRMPFRHVDIERAVSIGAPPEGGVVSRDEIEALRIRIGEPVMGVDFDESTIPQEGIDVTTSVDFDKGCYLGQELVARIDSRGHVNRRLAGLVAERGMLPVGTEVARGGRTVGRVTSAASYRSGTIALTMIRTEVEMGARVEVTGRSAEVVSLPMAL